MKALKIILYVIAALIIIPLIVAIFLPSNVSIEKSIEINKPISFVFSQVNVLSNWEKWSPFSDEYPDMVNEYSDVKEGVGAVMSWTGEESGSGSMTITTFEKDKYIECKLNFMEEDTTTLNISKWYFKENNGVTKVTWIFESSNLSYPMGKIFGLLMPMMMEKSILKGLEKLKLVSESTLESSIVKIEEKTTLDIFAYTISDSAKIQDLGAKLGQIFGEVSAFVTSKKIECLGAPFAIYYNWEPDGYIKIEAGIPVSSDSKVKPANADIRYKKFPSTLSIQTVHVGSYESSGIAHNEIDRYIENNKLTKLGHCFEHYITDPGNEPDTMKWQTLIVYPISK